MYEKALFRAALWYAKAKGRIVNDGLLSRLFSIADKLKATFKRGIWRVGLAEARDILVLGEKYGVLQWCPRLREWLTDQGYVFWLGLMTVSSRNISS